MSYCRFGTRVGQFTTHAMHRWVVFGRTPTGSWYPQTFGLHAGTDDEMKAQRRFDALLPTTSRRHMEFDGLTRVALVDTDNRRILRYAENGREEAVVPASNHESHGGNSSIVATRTESASKPWTKSFAERE